MNNIIIIRINNTMREIMNSMVYLYDDKKNQQQWPKNHIHSAIFAAFNFNSIDWKRASNAFKLQMPTGFILLFLCARAFPFIHFGSRVDNAQPNKLWWSNICMSSIASYRRIHTQRRLILSCHSSSLVYPYQNQSE